LSILAENIPVVNVKKVNFPALRNTLHFS